MRPILLNKSQKKAEISLKNVKFKNPAKVETKIPWGPCTLQYNDKKDACINRHGIYRVADDHNHELLMFNVNC